MLEFSFNLYESKLNKYFGWDLGKFKVCRDFYCDVIFKVEI